MNKKTIIRFTSLILCLLLALGVSYAWYKNNRQVDIISSNNIKIEGDGIILVANALNTNGGDIKIEDASFSKELELDIGDGYEDISGNGQVFYKSDLDADGNPVADQWAVVSPDAISISSDNDTGKYVSMDLYFKSDKEMDLYLIDSSDLEPYTNTNTLLVTSSALNTFDSYPNGLGNPCVDPSGYGFFSKNLIAAAGRVAFSEYENIYGSSPSLPVAPNLVWLPNCKYSLTKGENGRLYSFSLNGTKEKNYQYYDGSALHTIKRVGNIATGDLTGELYIKKTSSSDYENVGDTTRINGELCPARYDSNFTNPFPRIWNGTAFTDAALCDFKSTTASALVQAEYDEGGSNYGIKSFYGSETVYVKASTDGYIKLSKNNNTQLWEDTTTEYSGADVQTIEQNMTTDSAFSYFCSEWIDEDNFTLKSIDGQKLSKFKIGSLTYHNGYYYTRIKINVWVEGYDNEADISLSGGRFNIKLRFYGADEESNLEDLSQ